MEEFTIENHKRFKAIWNTRLDASNDSSQMFWQKLFAVEKKKYKNSSPRQGTNRKSKSNVKYRGVKKIGTRSNSCIEFIFGDDCSIYINPWLNDTSTGHTTLEGGKDTSFDFKMLWSMAREKNKAANGNFKMKEEYSSILESDPTKCGFFLKMTPIDRLKERNRWNQPFRKYYTHEFFTISCDYTFEPWTEDNTTYQVKVLSAERYEMTKNRTIRCQDDLLRCKEHYHWLRSKFDGHIAKKYFEQIDKVWSEIYKKSREHFKSLEMWNDCLHFFECVDLNLSCDSEKNHLLWILDRVYCALYKDGDTFSWSDP